MYNTLRWRMNELRKPEDQLSIVRNSGSWMFPAGQVSFSHHTTQTLGANLRPDTLSIMVEDVYHTHRRRMNELRKSEDQPSIVRNSGSRVFPVGQVSNPHHATQTLGANLRLDPHRQMELWAQIPSTTNELMHSAISPRICYYHRQILAIYRRHHLSAHFATRLSKS